MPGATVEPLSTTASEIRVLSHRWQELDPGGYKRAKGNPFTAIEQQGWAYGSASHFELGGYIHKAWIKVPGRGAPLVAGSTSKLLSVLCVLTRAVILNRPQN